MNLEEDVWSFITSNQVFEVYDYVTLKLEKAISYSHDSPDALSKFYKPALAYIDALPDRKN